MVIAVTIVMMVQVTFYEITGVITMRDSLMTTIFTMHVTGLVSFTGMLAAKSMFIYMVAMLVMQMSVMQIVRVVAVLDRSVTAGR